MPFIQMENISHFLRACESPPLNMPSHDRFLTVDLYESKDPAQVLQCLGAFSRIAHSIAPSKFPSTIGPRKAGVISPTRTGGATNGDSYGVSRGPSGASATSSTYSTASRPVARSMSPDKTGGSNSSSQAGNGPLSPSGPVSSWSKKTDQGTTAPAWNIAQYG